MSSPFHLNEETGNYLPTRPLTKEDIIDQAKEIIACNLRRDSDCLCNPEVVRDYLIVKLGAIDRETFACLYLDNCNRVISFETLFVGTIDRCTVYPREIVKAELNNNAAAVILAHNHPSGISEPSEADRCITSQLKKALKLVDIRLLDHFVVGEGRPFSFAETGLL